jgi:flagellar assembly protein FliH
MQRHVFDGVNRVSQKSAEVQRVMRWLPPTIDKGGKLIHAEPREESQLRQAVAQSAGASGDAQANSAPAAVGFGDSYDEGFEQGLKLGRNEGLQKGLAEGRAQGQQLGFEQGHAEGLAKGQQEGHKQGLQQAEREIRQQLNLLNSMMTHLAHALNEQDYQLEQALLNIVREVSRQVIQRELSVDSGHIMKIVQQALNTLPPSRDNLRILVNPADKALVMRAAEEGGENWRVLSSAQIERGGCRVETDQSAVDFTTSERFNQVIQQIAHKQFIGEGDSRHNGLPVGEALQDAPEPLVRPASAAAEEPL